MRVAATELTATNTHIVCSFGVKKSASGYTGKGYPLLHCCLKGGTVSRRGGGEGAFSQQDTTTDDEEGTRDRYYYDGLHVIEIQNIYIYIYAKLSYC